MEVQFEMKQEAWEAVMNNTDNPPDLVAEDVQNFVVRYQNAEHWADARAILNGVIWYREIQ